MMQESGQNQLFEDKGSIRSMSDEDLELHRLNLCFEHVDMGSSEP